MPLLIETRNCRHRHREKHSCSVLHQKGTRREAQLLPALSSREMAKVLFARQRVKQNVACHAHLIKLPVRKDPEEHTLGSRRSWVSLSRRHFLKLEQREQQLSSFLA